MALWIEYIFVYIVCFDDLMVLYICIVSLAKILSSLCILFAVAHMFYIKLGLSSK